MLLSTVGYCSFNLGNLWSALWEQLVLFCDQLLSIENHKWWIKFSSDEEETNVLVSFFLVKRSTYRCCALPVCHWAKPNEPLVCLLGYQYLESTEGRDFPIKLAEFLNRKGGTNHCSHVGPHLRTPKRCQNKKSICNLDPIKLTPRLMRCGFFGWKTCFHGTP